MAGFVWIGEERGREEGRPSVYFPPKQSKTAWTIVEMEFRVKAIL